MPKNPVSQETVPHKGWNNVYPVDVDVEGVKSIRTALNGLLDIHGQSGTTKGGSFKRPELGGTEKPTTVSEIADDSHRIVVMTRADLAARIEAQPMKISVYNREADDWELQQSILHNPVLDDWGLYEGRTGEPSTQAEVQAQFDNLVETVEEVITNPASTLGSVALK